jgi:hypothetical protein
MHRQYTHASDVTVLDLQLESQEMVLGVLLSVLVNVCRRRGRSFQRPVQLQPPHSNVKQPVTPRK